MDAHPWWPFGAIYDIMNTILIIELALGNKTIVMLSFTDLNNIRRKKSYLYLGPIYYKYHGFTFHRSKLGPYSTDAVLWAA